jgi:hypothetical protein
MGAMTFIDCGIWIPWCTQSSHFDDHHLRIHRYRFEIGDTFAIWQSWKDDGDHVRRSLDGKYYEPGACIEGESGVNGDRRLVVHNGGIFLSREFPATSLPGA